MVLLMASIHHHERPGLVPSVGLRQGKDAAARLRMAAGDVNDQGAHHWTTKVNLQGADAQDGKLPGWTTREQILKDKMMNYQEDGSKMAPEVRRIFTKSEVPGWCLLNHSAKSR